MRTQLWRWRATRRPDDEQYTSEWWGAGDALGDELDDVDDLAAPPDDSAVWPNLFATAQQARYFLPAETRARTRRWRSWWAGCSATRWRCTPRRAGGGARLASRSRARRRCSTTIAPATIATGRSTPTAASSCGRRARCAWAQAPAVVRRPGARARRRRKRLGRVWQRVQVVAACRRERGVSFLRRRRRRRVGRERVALALAATDREAMRSASRADDASGAAATRTAQQVDEEDDANDGDRAARRTARAGSTPTGRRRGVPATSVDGATPTGSEDDGGMSTGERRRPRRRRIRPEARAGEKDP